MIRGAPRSSFRHSTCARARLRCFCFLCQRELTLSAPVERRPLDEPARLEALARYEILDTPREKDFDDVAALAAAICGTPIAVVNLIGEGRQFFKAEVGLGVRETPLDSSFCAHAILEEEFLLVADATKDARFVRNPLVTGEPHLRFYAGALLRTEDGQPIGTVCVLDYEARELTPTQTQTLRILARQVMTQLDLRLALRRERERERRHAQILGSAVDYAIVTLDLNGRVTTWNEGARRVLGWSAEEMLGRPADIIFTEEDRLAGAPQAEMRAARADGRALDERWHVRKDRSRFWGQGEMVPLLGPGDVQNGYLKILRDRTEQQRAATSLRESEERWRGLFERLSEGFIVGEAVRGPSGRIADWRCIEANSAWGELFGVDPEAAVGRILPGSLLTIEDAWVEEFSHVVETGDPVAFRRQVGGVGRWYEGRAFPLEGDVFGAIFLEVTDRVSADERRDALLELGDRLRNLRTVPEVARVACEIVGRTLRADRVAFGRADVTGEHVDVDVDWTVDGMVSIAGRHRLEEYGEAFRQILLNGDTLVVEDVLSNPLTAASAELFLEVGTRSIVNMPVRERGQQVGILIVHSREPRAWSAERLAFLRNVADRVEVGSARLRAEEEQRLLNLELNHRMKNSMAMIQAIAAHTLKGVTERDAVENFYQRLHALSAAHDVLVHQNWTSARIDNVVMATVAAFGHLERIAASGPPVTLNARSTFAFSLLLHELATNAVKYGALSTESGHVRVTWRLEGHELVVDWREIGGPPAHEPVRKGFGSRLMRMGLAGTGGVELRYLASGFQAEMRAPIARLQD